MVQVPRRESVRVVLMSRCWFSFVGWVVVKLQVVPEECLVL